MEVLGKVLAFIGMLVVTVVLFTGPSWYIWNHIIVEKFNAPTFSFWEAFWVIIMIKGIFTTNVSVNKD